MTSQSLQHKRYEMLKDKIKQRYPKAKIKYKEDSWWWSKLPDKMKSSGTTLGNTIWMPYKSSNFGMLAHEYQHLVDINSMGFLGFMMMYLQPQWFSIFMMFFAIVALGFQLIPFAIAAGIAALLLLLPWPSKGRAYLEMKGYLMSIYVDTIEGYPTETSMNFVVDSLRSWLYYKMVWTRTHAVQLVDEASEALVDRDCIPNISIAFQDVHEIIVDTEKAVLQESR